MAAFSSHHPTRSDPTTSRPDSRFPTLTQQLYQLASSSVTSEELVQRSLRAITASQSTLNAFRVVLTDQALADAREADRKRAAGQYLPL
ncbi:MAG: amidase, partial [Mycobacterium sp.]|nr:amidase [Mycobacterium sp.]